PESAADITFTGQSDLSILMNLTLEDNAEAGGFTYQLEKWNGAKWVVETASGNSTSTSAKASISTWGAVYRATVYVEDACDGYTLSENATTGIFQADLEVPAEDPVLLLTTDGNYMCFLWRYTNPNSQFNLARAQFFQSGTGKDVFTQAGVSGEKGMFCIRGIQADTSQSVQVEFSVGSSITADGEKYSKFSPTKILPQAYDFSEYSIVKAYSILCDAAGGSCDVTFTIDGSIRNFIDDMFVKLNASEANRRVQFNKEIEVRTLLKGNQQSKSDSNQASQAQPAERSFNQQLT
ncbi:uncharacterized protein LOC142355545, partial [Convolutriloba macropyga]|uniref:uncharacterized protein LOC142355545 n=1 Tax=Convolutriloba macropyga TaxID=536237 RepID=UPI003F51F875